MKRITLVAAFVLISSSAWGQAQAPAAGKPQAAKEAAKPAAEQVADGKKSRRSEDARHCLEKSTNIEIIRCAEAYL
jgi:hypothetical protein